MRPINDFLLNIDAKNEHRYQFIHVDVKEQYGIACKFSFSNSNPNEFIITHIKSISYNKFNGTTKEYKVSIKDKTREISHSNEYDYQIDIELTQITGSNDSDFRTSESHNDNKKHKYKRKKGKPVDKSFRIDTHILNPPYGLNTPQPESTTDEQILNKNIITFGNQFCKFVID